MATRCRLELFALPPNSPTHLPPTRVLRTLARAVRSAVVDRRGNADHVTAGNAIHQLARAISIVRVYVCTSFATQYISETITNANYLHPGRSRATSIAVRACRVRRNTDTGVVCWTWSIWASSTISYVRELSRLCLTCTRRQLGSARSDVDTSVGCIHRRAECVHHHLGSGTQVCRGMYALSSGSI
jgi:hypothetical protein